MFRKLVVCLILSKALLRGIEKWMLNYLHPSLPTHPHPHILHSLPHRAWFTLPLDQHMWSLEAVSCGGHHLGYSSWCPLCSSGSLQRSANAIPLWLLIWILDAQGPELIPWICHSPNLVIHSCLIRFEALIQENIDYCSSSSSRNRVHNCLFSTSISLTY